MTTTILAGGRPLTLLAEKAAFLAASRTLLVADAHIGKAVSFRALGVPVPRGTTSETLAALSALIATWRARRVVFLGDFLHSARSHAAATLGAVARWRREHAALELVLVRGNHDDRAGDPPPYLGMRVVDEPFELDGFALCHHPRPRRGAYVLAGHLHPCVSLGGRALRPPAPAVLLARRRGRRAAGVRRVHRHAPDPRRRRATRLRDRRRRRHGDAQPRVAEAGDRCAAWTRMAFDPAPLLALVARAEALVARLEARAAASARRARLERVDRVSLSHARRQRRPARAGAPRRRDPPRRAGRGRARRRSASSATPSSSSPARRPTTCC